MAERIVAMAVDAIERVLLEKVGAKKLSSTLSKIQDFLSDAEDRQIKDKVLRRWLSDLKGVADEAEDILKAKVLLPKQKSRMQTIKRKLFKVFTCPVSYLIRNIRIVEITERLETIEREGIDRLYPSCVLNSERLISGKRPPTGSIADETIVFESSSSLRTRLPDLPTSCAGQNNFRVEGVEEGEFNSSCLSVGLSGPEDFAIPAAGWEARKTSRLSDVLLISRFQEPNSPNSAAAVAAEDVELPTPMTPPAPPPIKERDLVAEITATVSISEELPRPPPHQEEDLVDDLLQSLTPKDDAALIRGGCISDESEEDEGTNGAVVGAEEENGVKRARHPILAPRPSMSLPVLDNGGSTWDLLQSLAPEDDAALIRGGCVSDESEEDEGTNGAVVGAEEESGGVKRARHPVLAPLPVLDKGGSTWDLLQSLAPEDDAALIHGGCVSDESEEDEGTNGAIVGAEEERGVRSGETKQLTGSASFLTANDDDSSSSTTEPLSIILANGRFRRSISSWTRGELIGIGSYGMVYEGLSKDGFFFAMKEVSLVDQGSQAQQCIRQLEQEIALLSQFEHENIVQYLGTGQEEAKLYIFLELVTKGSLASLYQKYHLSETQVSAYTRQILNGLNYLHDRDVMHRDIKCANILVDANGTVKLADFGLAKEISKVNMSISSKGSAYWMAPEVINRRNTCGLAADIWSLGCCVLEMLIRQPPYYPLERAQAIFRIGRSIPPPIPDSLTSDAQDFIRQCLQVVPDDRPPASELLEHPFVKRALPASVGCGSSSNSDARA